MKKTWLLLIVALLVCALGVFAFAACDDLKTEKANLTDDNSASNLKGSVALVNAFLAETLKDPDFVVTCTDAAGAVRFTETVKGTDSYTLSQSGSKTYAFIKEDVTYWVSLTPEKGEDGSVTERRDYACSDSTKDSYLATIESAYESTYCQFLGSVKLVENYPEEGATVSCKVVPETVEGVSVATLTLNYTAPGMTFKLTADSKEKLVQSIHLELSSDSSSDLGYDLTLTFVYGSAAIDLPDVEAWEREEAERKQRLAANEKAIADRDEFLSGAIGAQNVNVSVLDYSTFSTLTEKIANDIDYVDHGTYKTYAYTEGEDNYLLRVDGSRKTYLKNAVDHDDNLLVWYSSCIAMKDDLTETATFSFKEENGTMTYGVKVANNTVYSISAMKTEGVVNQISAVGTNNDGNSVMIMITLSYGDTQLEKPDLSEFELLGE